MLQDKFKDDTKYIRGQNENFDLDWSDDSSLIDENEEQMQENDSLIDKSQQNGLELQRSNSSETKRTQDKLQVG